MDRLNFIIILITIINSVYGDLRIIDLKVPSTIENGSSDEVILDCEFESSNESGLVVKWFYNNQEQQIYQWIPSTKKKPQALGFFKDIIDLDYKASNDSNTMYRALRIKKVTPELSGDYTCKVTSFYDEDTATKKMIIYEAAKEFEFVQYDDTNIAICSASGLYPEPKMNVYILGLNKTAEDDIDGDGVPDKEDRDLNNNGIEDDKEEELQSGEDDDDIDLTEDNLYNITSILNYSHENFDDAAVALFVCDLWIPGTTYKRTITRSVLSENKSSYLLPSSALVLMSLLPFGLLLEDF